MTRILRLFASANDLNTAWSYTFTDQEKCNAIFEREKRVIGFPDLDLKIYYHIVRDRRDLDPLRDMSFDMMELSPYISLPNEIYQELKSITGLS